MKSDELLNYEPNHQTTNVIAEAKAKKCSGPTCSHDGCRNKVCPVRQFCHMHEAEITPRICKHEGCTNIALIRGVVCIRHVAKKVKKCCNEGCASHAVKGGVCLQHGAQHYLLSNCAQKGGVCH
jgi:hypothetical protein